MERDLEMAMYCLRGHAWA